MIKRILGLIVVPLCLCLSCRTGQPTDVEIRVDPAMQAERDHEVEEVLETIKGREQEPAEKVFMNIKVMKGIPAERLLRIMNVGYARSLGVECSHCHVEEYWEVDEKRPKNAAREMILMTRAINEQVGKMQHLEGDDPQVNCGTCHRGQVRPGSSARR